MAPYTSLLGPSGIGKSYAIRQIAQRDLGYVVYTCLTREISGAYTPRSIIADILLGHEKDAYFSSIDDEDLRRETATSLYECYFAAGVINVSLCRKFGIKPSVFYNSQTEKHFSDFQSECAEALKLLFGAVSKTHQEICAQGKRVSDLMKLGTMLDLNPVKISIPTYPFHLLTNLVTLTVVSMFTRKPLIEFSTPSELNWKARIFTSLSWI